MRRNQVYTSYSWSEQQVSNLNQLEIVNADAPDEPLTDAQVQTGDTTVHFRHLESALIDYINAADSVVGCVAWLTNKGILSALSQKDPVSLIVQKEDFLRPDVDNKGAWAKELRRRYDTLRCTYDRWDFGVWLSTMGDQSMSPVRCMGNHNHAKVPAFPRMHHKFVVFCKYRNVSEAQKSPDWYDDRQLLIPYAVWTGSFNFTENAGRSLENGLYLTHPEVVNAYYNEWRQILALSEPLNWESDWVAPEWRIGT